MRFISFLFAIVELRKEKRNISKLNKKIKNYLGRFFFSVCLSIPRESERKHERDRKRLTFETSIKRKEKFLHFTGV